MRRLFFFVTWWLFVPRYSPCLIVIRCKTVGEGDGARGVRMLVGGARRLFKAGFRCRKTRVFRRTTKRIGGLGSCAAPLAWNSARAKLMETCSAASPFTALTPSRATKHAARTNVLASVARMFLLELAESLCRTSRHKRTALK
jgi:hypothetical protein